ncbi:hypothetical protein AVEN_137762-1, partial [Araneus ventricosus]
IAEQESRATVSWIYVVPRPSRDEHRLSAHTSSGPPYIRDMPRRLSITRYCRRAHTADRSTPLIKSGNKPVITPQSIISLCQVSEMPKTHLIIMPKHMASSPLSGLVARIFTNVSRLQPASVFCSKFHYLNRQYESVYLKIHFCKQCHTLKLGEQMQSIPKSGQQRYGSGSLGATL